MSRRSRPDLDIAAFTASTAGFAPPPPTYDEMLAESLAQTKLLPDLDDEDLATAASTEQAPPAFEPGATTSLDANAATAEASEQPSDDDQGSGSITVEVSTGKTSPSKKKKKPEPYRPPMARVSGTNAGRRTGASNPIDAATGRRIIGRRQNNYSCASGSPGDLRINEDGLVDFESLAADEDKVLVDMGDRTQALVTIPKELRDFELKRGRLVHFARGIVRDAEAKIERSDGCQFIRRHPKKVRRGKKTLTFSPGPAASYVGGQEAGSGIFDPPEASGSGTGSDDIQVTSIYQPDIDPSVAAQFDFANYSASNTAGHVRTASETSTSSSSLSTPYQSTHESPAAESAPADESWTSSLSGSPEPTVIGQAYRVPVPYPSLANGPLTTSCSLANAFIGDGTGFEVPFGNNGGYPTQPAVAIPVLRRLDEQAPGTFVAPNATLTDALGGQLDFFNAATTLPPGLSQHVSLYQMPAPAIIQTGNDADPHSQWIGYGDPDLPPFPRFGNTPTKPCFATDAGKTPEQYYTAEYAGRSYRGEDPPLGAPVTVPIAPIPLHAFQAVPESVSTEMARQTQLAAPQLPPGLPDRPTAQIESIGGAQASLLYLPEYRFPPVSSDAAPRPEGYVPLRPHPEETEEQDETPRPSAAG